MIKKNLQKRDIKIQLSLCRCPIISLIDISCSDHTFRHYQPHQRFGLKGTLAFSLLDITLLTTSLALGSLILLNYLTLPAAAAYASFGVSCGVAASWFILTIYLSNHKKTFFGWIEQDYGRSFHAITEFSSSYELSPIGRQALTFSENLLVEHPSISSLKMVAAQLLPASCQPHNLAISRLDLLLRTVLFPEFRRCLEKNSKNGKDPWKTPSEELLQAANSCMQVAYALSVLMLEDIKEQLPELKSGEEELSESQQYAKALVCQRYYWFLTYYSIFSIYHLLRGKSVVEKKNLKPFRRQEQWVYNQTTLSSDPADPFHEQGTFQNHWRELYNDYCDRIIQYATIEDIRKKDARYAHYIKKDTLDSPITPFLNPSNFNLEPEESTYPYLALCL